MYEYSDTRLIQRYKNRSSTQFSEEEWNDIVSHFLSHARYKEAEQASEESIAQHPYSLDLLFIRATVLLEQDKLVELEQLINRITQIDTCTHPLADPDNYTDFQLLRIEYTLRRGKMKSSFRMALTLEQTIVTRFRESAESQQDILEDLYLNLSSVYTDNNLYFLALFWLRKAAKICPWKQDTWEDMACCYHQFARNPAMDRSQEIAIVNHPQLHNSLKNPLTHACRCYQKMLALNPYQLRTWMALAQTHYLMGDYEQVLRDIPFMHDLEQLAHTQSLVENHRQGVQDTPSTLDLEPSIKEEILLLEGGCLAKLGHYPEAADKLYDACLLQGSNAQPEHLSSLADVYYALKDYPQAIHWYQQVLNKLPEQPEALFGIGASLCNEGHYTEGITYLKRLAQADPEQAEAYLYLGQAYHWADQNEKALQSLQTSLRLGGNTPELHATLGEVSFELGYYESALSAYQETYALQPNFPEIDFLLASAYYACQETDKAAQHLRKAVADNPDNLHAFCTLFPEAEIISSQP